MNEQTMNAQDRAFLENLPEYQLHQKLLEIEAQLIALLLADDPEDLMVA